MKTDGMFRVLTHPRLLDLAADVIGSNELLAHPQFNSRAKLPAHITAAAEPDMRGTSPAEGVGYHQDAELLNREVDHNRMANFVCQDAALSCPARVCFRWVI